MKTLPISPSTISSSTSKAKFIVLGSKDVKSKTFAPQLKNKINKKTTEQVSGAWGTLGLQTGKNIHWKGKLEFSKTGNEKSKGEVLKQIKKLYAGNDQLNTRYSKVTERFINFDKVVFTDFPETFTEKQIPNARLTLFLKPDEGALVFYQHFKGSYHSERNSAIEYILHEPERSKKRDRLTYIFPILPPQKIVPAGKGLFTLSDKKLDKSFVVKILTFKKSELADKPKLMIRSMAAKALSTDDKYKLLKFDPAQNLFTDISNNSAVIAPLAKTLFLIHGTFSTTDNSFNGLMNKEYDGNTKSWLQKIIDQKGYQQILALDHPTITDDAAANVTRLKELLNGVSFKGNTNVDVITTSRGGLVGKYLVACLQDDYFPVRKMVNIACANGVGYFDTAKGIARFLSAYNAFADATGNVLGSVISGIAQYAVKDFIAMPGCRQMTIDDPLLTNILNHTTLVPGNQYTRIQPVVGDWDPILAKNEKFLMRLAERGLDLLIQLCLDKENDWVVGTEKQKIRYADYSNDPIQVRSMHIRYLNSDICPDHVHDIISNFL